MKILIDARLRDGESGGIQQVIIGLAQGFSQIDLGNYQITYLMLSGHTSWLDPYLSSNVRIYTIDDTKATHQSTSAKSYASRFRRFVRRSIGHLLGPLSVRIEQEPTALATIKPDLVHFVHQNCFSTTCPFIFTPHDLQHEHLPEHFEKRDLMARRHRYKKFARTAKAIACISESCRQDVVKYLGIEAEKCHVLYNASPVGGYSKPNSDVIEKVKAKYSLPENFIFYPAKTYAHKNHVRLIQVVSKLRDNGFPVHVICSGPKTDYYEDQILPLLLKLQLQDRVRFIGWVEPEEIGALYSLTQALVFPSEFEGFGIPLVEAMQFGLPIVCSNRSSIPEIVQDAGIYFDPIDESSIIKALITLYTDELIVAKKREYAIRRANNFSWTTSAKKYLNLYQYLLR